MNCDFCGFREAVIHIHQIMGNKKRKLHLCEQCAAERGITNIQDKVELDIAHLFANLFDYEKSAPVNTETKICPVCGLNFEQFNRNNVFGCNNCYTEFGKLLRYKMKKLTGSVQYTGKVPARLQSYKVLFIDMQKLKNRLEEAVKNEEYEKAASIRDEINRIRHKGYVDNRGYTDGNVK